MSRGFTPPTECPVCGESVPRDAKACPECGADERSGWNEDDARYDGLDLPGAAFDDEAPSGSSARPSPQRGATGWFWLLVAGILLGLFILSIFIR
jgi:hypothetical protein